MDGGGEGGEGGVGNGGAGGVGGGGGGGEGEGGAGGGVVRVLNARWPSVSLLDGPSADVRHAAHRLVYRYALPYT